MPGQRWCGRRFEREAFTCLPTLLSSSTNLVWSTWCVCLIECQIEVVFIVDADAGFVIKDFDERFVNARRSILHLPPHLNDALFFHETLLLCTLKSVYKDICGTCKCFRGWKFGRFSRQPLPVPGMHQREIAIKVSTDLRYNYKDVRGSGWCPIWSQSIWE
jgi:hypothetical protein